MSKQRAYVAVLLDRTGSMQVNKAETISAYNQYVDKLKSEVKGRFTLTQFDSESIDSPQEHVKIKEVVHLTDATYQPRASTPLLDAIGKTIHTMAPKTEGFDNVIFVILTDGEENASTEYTRDGIKQLIEEKQKLGWQVSYLGANVDAFHEAGQLGIRGGQAMNFVGTQSVATMDSYFASNKRYLSRPVKTDTSAADFTDDERKKAVGDGTSKT